MHISWVSTQEETKDGGESGESSGSGADAMMRRSSKPQVAHLRLMGRQKVAWRMHQMRREIFRLAGLLKRTREDLERTREDLELATSKFRDANWALHELSNGAGLPAVQLYRAGELIDRIPYHKRDRMGLLVWRAAAAMKSSQSVSSY